MTAYLSCLAPQDIITSLALRGMRTVALPAFSALSCPVSSHADMLLLDAGDCLFTYEGYTFAEKDALFGKFSKTVRLPDPTSSEYPHDISLNIAVAGNKVFANTKNAARSAIEYLTSLGKTIIHVNQGYAHCSVCVVNDNALITADRGIADAARQNGLDVLLIESGHVTLPPYSYGFIGGASGSDEENVYFCGSLSYHPNGEEIKKFCISHGKTPVELSDSPLCDVGGILIK